ncbi:hypothetical protein LOTGIDRAFT_233962 [Lottia gigantea]|uniref:Uncharacterized protein n=1 Tax=Lottia gigantea TaxID=225164 RepID=V4BMK0_LOTGI|nr:hypothetical protein LOTGIDRAFT_233962 [Lottia gigantea]ESO90169.1 hypothetical protein LOTGIDRAFT_233962 [Lottia gigantea]
MDAAPYDNVEFPVRKPGTGTWPGPGQQQSQIKLMSQTSKDRSGGAKLAPLMETMELADSEDQRNQSKTVTASSKISSSAVGVQGIPQLQSTTAIKSSYLLSSSVSSNSSQSNQQPQLVNATYTPQKVSNQQQTIKYKADTRSTITTDQDDFFDRKDFSAGSRNILDKAYSQHKHFYRLNAKVVEEGGLLKQDVLDVYKKQGEVFTYEQLLQGMLIDGEKLLLGGSWLYVTGVEYLDADGNNVLKEPVGKGRICLTNQRVLILSAEIYIDASLSELGNNNKPSTEYKLDVRKTNSTYYQNLPLTCFHSADLNISVGTSASSKISMKKPVCKGLCSCFGVAPCVTSWQSTPPMTTAFNKRIIRVGVSMPPWATRMTLLFHLDPEMSLTVARDFISQLQYHAPLMH